MSYDSFHVDPFNANEKQKQEPRVLIGPRGSFP